MLWTLDVVAEDVAIEGCWKCNCQVGGKEKDRKRDVRILGVGAEMQRTGTDMYVRFIMHVFGLWENVYVANLHLFTLDNVQINTF